MEKDFINYEKNEYAIANAITELFKIKDYQINPLNNDFEKIDMFFSFNQKKYAVEIKCRKEYKISGMMIEQTKLIEMVKHHKEGLRCRYINYIEEKDQLVIFDLNTRFEQLELQKIFDNPYKYSNYQSMLLPSTTVHNNKVNKKYVAFVQYNDYQTKDYYIDNFTEYLYKNNIKNFVYDGQDKLKKYWDFYYTQISPASKPNNYELTYYKA